MTMDSNPSGSQPSSSTPYLEVPKNPCLSSVLASKGLPPDTEIVDRLTFEKGTTALAFVFKEGVMVAVDHSIDYRTASSELLPENVVALNSHMLATISGGCEYLLKDLQMKCHDYELNERRRASAAEASKWLADTLSSNNDEGLPVGILVAGWDGSKPGLYHVDGKGKMVKKSFEATGSGSGYAFGVLALKPFLRLTFAAAVFLAKKALVLASYHAPESHEFVGVYHVGCDGWCTKVFDDDIGDWRSQLVLTPLWMFPNPTVPLNFKD